MLQYKIQTVKKIAKQLKTIDMEYVNKKETGHLAPKCDNFIEQLLKKYYLNDTKQLITLNALIPSTTMINFWYENYLLDHIKTLNNIGIQTMFLMTIYTCLKKWNRS